MEEEETANSSRLYHKEESKARTEADAKDRMGFSMDNPLASKWESNGLCHKCEKTCGYIPGEQ